MEAERLITVPEFILHTTLENTLKFIREDYKLFKDQNKPEQSYIHKLCFELGFQRYNYIEQAVAVFTASNEDNRHLTLDLMFNMTSDSPPSIHITMPSETPGQNALGMGEDSNDNFLNYQEVDNEQVSDTVQSIFNRRYRANYDILILSDNSNEVVMLYHVVKALLVALSPQFTLLGLENITFGGQDLQAYADLAPKNLFMRAVRLGLEYNSSTLNFAKHPLITEIVFNPQPVSEITESTTTTTTTTIEP